MICFSISSARDHIRSTEDRPRKHSCGPARPGAARLGPGRQLLDFIHRNGGRGLPAQFPGPGDLRRRPEPDRERSREDRPPGRDRGPGGPGAGHGRQVGAGRHAERPGVGFERDRVHPHLRRRRHPRRRPGPRDLDDHRSRRRRVHAAFLVLSHDGSGQPPERGLDRHTRFRRQRRHRGRPHPDALRPSSFRHRRPRRPSRPPGLAQPRPPRPAAIPWRRSGSRSRGTAGTAGARS
jgi:hypothetical protein